MKKKLLACILVLVLSLGLAVPASAYGVGEAQDAAIAMSISHAAYVDGSGVLWTWGRNHCGELGNGSRENSNVPVQVLEDVASVSVSDGVTAAIKTDGTLWMWGSNYHGQLGNGGIGDLNIYGTGHDHKSDHYIQTTPMQVMEDVRAVYTSNIYTAAIKTDGSLWMWGDNQYGHLGNGGGGDLIKPYFGEDMFYQTTPVKVMDDAASFAFSDDANCVAVIKNDGTLWMWGSNEYGQLGNGGEGNGQYEVDVGEDYPEIITYQTVPVPVMEDVSAVSIGANHAAAVKADGSLWTWGSNYYGQLGSGTTEDSLVPVKVMEGVSSVSLGWSSSAAVKVDGALWTWGRNYYGQLGNGTTEDTAVPAQVLDSVADVSCDRDYYIAVKTDGSLWTWGWNYNGQLGSGTRESILVPGKVLESVAAAAGDQTSMLALKADGSLWSWGDNYYGHLGNGSVEGVAVPTRIRTGAASENPDAPDGLPFVDVAPTDWFYEGVRYAYEHNLMRGDGSEAAFNPGGTTTRAMLVTILYRLEGEPETGPSAFLDVPAGQWYTAPVAWAAANGIVNGRGEGFDPMGVITRQDFATILYRYAGAYKGLDMPTGGELLDFADGADVADYARGPMMWAVGEGLVNGIDGRLEPAGGAVRAQAAVILARFCEKWGK